MEINKKLNELLDLLDNNSDIKKIKELKSKIYKNELDLINNYRNDPSIDNKKKLYENEIINEYLICENHINYLIIEVNNKFKRSRKCPK